MHWIRAHVGYAYIERYNDALTKSTAAPSNVNAQILLYSRKTKKMTLWHGSCRLAE